MFIKKWNYETTLFLKWSFINLDKNLKEQDELYKLIGKINEALNYKTTISQINYTSSFINYELLRELIKESDNIINQKKYQNFLISKKVITESLSRNC